MSNELTKRVITICCEGKQKEQPDSSPLALPGQSHRHKQRLRPTHKPKDLEAAFVSNPYYEPERWKAEGADVERDQLVHPADADAAPGMLHYYNQVTERVTISCRRCGYEVELGDRLGVGYPTMVEGRAAAAVGNGYRTKPERLAADRHSPSLENEPVPAAVPVQPMRPDIALAMAGEPTVSTNPALHEKLSTFADMFADADGVSRLPLSALDRIVRTFH